VLTKIVLLATKAVGDVLGVRGIADENIRFNGYPFLEKDEHVYDVPGEGVNEPVLRVILIRSIVSHIMRRHILTLPARGLTLEELGKRSGVSSLCTSLILCFIEVYLNGTDVNGFPIVSDNETRTLVGHIGRRELRYAIGQFYYH
jgi:chloride channel 3/4/5